MHQRQRCAVSVSWRAADLSPGVLEALGWSVDVDEVERIVATLAQASLDRRRQHHPDRADIELARAAIDGLYRRIDRSTGLAIVRRHARHRCHR